MKRQDRRPRIAAVLLAVAMVLPACARGQGLYSHDGRHRAETVQTPTGIHYRVVEVRTGRVVLTTTARYPTWNDVKSGMFSPRSAKPGPAMFAAAYQYSHEGPMTWIGVWSLDTGEFRYARMQAGFTGVVASVFDEKVGGPAVGLDTTVSAGRLLAPEFKRGVAYTSWRPGEYSSAQSDDTLARRLKPLGVTWIALLVTCYQKTVASLEITCGPDTPSDADLVHAIRRAHEVGIDVMLKPHVDLGGDPGHWRGQISSGASEEAWARWFRSYSRFIRHYAALAERERVKIVAVGTELEGTSHRDREWREVIRLVREAYSGHLIYAANWTEAEQVTWWDALDLIGVDAYFPLTDGADPAPDELRAAWRPVAARMDALATTWNRKILFTEIGYRSVDGANRRPFDYTTTAARDLDEQADCYRAAFEAIGSEPWLDGFFWWNWTTDPGQGGPLDVDYTPGGKPAEAVLRAFYAGHGPHHP